MYVVVKTVKGKRYRYLQRSYREGGKVRTESVYLGPAGVLRRAIKGVADFARAQCLDADERANVRAERHVAKIECEQRERFGETAQERGERERQEGLDKLHAAYGLRVGEANAEPTVSSGDAGDKAIPE